MVKQKMDEVCKVCGRKLKILFHIQAYCPNDCDKKPPGNECCPKCKSSNTDRTKFFTLYSYRLASRCIKCGHVWDFSEDIPSTD